MNLIISSMASSPHDVINFIIIDGKSFTLFFVAIWVLKYNREMYFINKLNKLEK